MLPSEHCLQLTGPSGVLQTSDMDACRRICESSRRWLRQRAIQWIGQHVDEPMLYQSSADGTPITTRRVFKRAHESLKVTRSGKQTSEYLVQRVFLMLCDRRPIPVFREPVSMSNKSAIVHMKAGMDLFPNPREVGHRGYLVDHKVYDRAVMSALKKLWDKWAAAHHLYQK